jgi:hypothetical protein
MIGALQDRATTSGRVKAPRERDRILIHLHCIPKRQLAEAEEPTAQLAAFLMSVSRCRLRFSASQ